ncbi:putative histidinol-phosphatase [Escovopsis weberi]|uniref:Histidinol-phosphatase n=1 Tax=Escovopsis weberi TaxID=150374 RepID=A0A0M9VVP3_ESCWE|nr:putative histidinol-phosphatase [Escovopsis weberi]
MAFTMHSHSGQFCPSHAVDQLEDIIKHAISLGYRTIGLSEHMPRYEAIDLYPDELDDPQASITALAARHDLYLLEAQRLQTLYAPRIHILIGFEAEFIRPSFAPLVRALAAPACVDYFVGSVHHVHGIPIDYDSALYAAAVAAAGGSEERLFEAYYDLQLEMLAALRPRIVGHFDLVRLLSEAPARDVREWEGVWARVRRNLAACRDMGAWLECNSSALRKGLAEPYPCAVIAEEWIRQGGRFTMGDDSHGIAQVATNYARALDFLEALGVEQVWTLRREGGSPDSKAVLEDVPVAITEFRQSLLLK